MLTLMTFLLIIILISRITEESIKIPSTLSLIVYAFILSYFFPNMMNITNEEFDDILYLMLPIILLPDVLNLSIDELKKHSKEIFYLAFVAVILSIIVAVFITPYILPQHQWNIGILIALFSMLMATDAITVASIMSKFKLPKRLKIYAESESLFNDVTALIIFYFIAIPLISGNEVTFFSINITLFKVLFLSIIIGIAVAGLGYLSTKILKNPLDQFIILYLIVIISFLLAEHFHIAGILSIVASVLTFKTFVLHEINHKNVIAKIESKSQDVSLLEHIQNITTITKKGFKEHQKEAMFIGIFANGIVFIIIANIINFEALKLYYVEILTIFVFTTLIRFGAIFTMIKTMKLPMKWSYTLTFAGSKGALAIIMSHSLPNDFIYREMFMAIIVGVVLLSTFIYTIILMFHIYKSRLSYAQDILIYDKNEDKNVSKNYVHNIIDILEKDAITGAYNSTFIEDILTKELARSQRYKTDLSILTFKIVDKTEDKKHLIVISEIIKKKIRVNDYFGKINNEQYIILTSNTSISGAVVLAEKIIQKTETMQNIELFFGVTQMSDTDDTGSIYDKLEDALDRAMLDDGERVEIEV